MYNHIKNHFITEVQQQLQHLTAMVQTLQAGREGGRQLPPEEDTGIQFPLQSLDDLDQIEEKLKNTCTKNQLVIVLKCINTLSIVFNMYKLSYDASLNRKNSKGFWWCRFIMNVYLK